MTIITTPFFWLKTMTEINREARERGELGEGEEYDEDDYWFNMKCEQFYAAELIQGLGRGWLQRNQDYWKTIDALPPTHRMEWITEEE